jgi:hypothetical protein
MLFQMVRTDNVANEPTLITDMIIARMDIVDDNGPIETTVYGSHWASKDIPM